VKSDFSTQYGDPWNGLTEAYELFTEFELPLVRDRLGARYLSVNFTGRRTLNKTKRRALQESTTFIDRGTEALDAQRYGTSWRASLNWGVTDWMRVRATKSADIRSPSSRELFSTITAQIGGLGFNSGFIRNPWRDPEGPGGGTTQNEDDYSVIRGSNETLGNELNGTKSLGIVVTPGGFAEGFSFSADYSELFVTGGITYLTGFFGEPGTEDEREEGLGFLPYPIYQCYTQNDPFWCDKVIFNPTASVDEPNTDGLDPYT